MLPESRINGCPVLVDAGGEAQPLQRVSLTPAGKSEFDEAWLQRLIHDNPACLPIGDIEPGLDPFLAICREMPTPHGPIDNLLLTGRGDIALVETKLFRNPEARRKVLAQALDYATCLFAMGYEEFEQATLAGNFEPQTKPISLYEAVSTADKLAEHAFSDAVVRNLRRGRVLILIAGDGIREDAERLLEGLNNHARFGFTIALVELAVFHVPGPPGGLLVCPSTMAKTSIVRRTVVELTGSQGAKVRDEELAIPETLSSENFWEILEGKAPGARAALEQLLVRLESLGVYPDFMKSLIFRFDRATGKSVNLGYVTRAGSIWTDQHSADLPRDLSHHYVQEVAQIFDCNVHTLPSSGNWSPYKDGKPLRLSSVISQISDWVGPIQRFITAINEYDARNNS
ncbi:hypothetical protein FE249_06935 [Acidiphilium multivorum]|uniref:hypothetical protein n=1 Tax=Acidiphilium multivorum TaxID=62140 RepID=UPI001F4BE959|nr:hypothetical protein [Acidiphilium multivorum]UNC13969.1 hypothetical protein FE249_06935 [Acidiphilium multivorum]